MMVNHTFSTLIAEKWSEIGKITPTISGCNFRVHKIQKILIAQNTPDKISVALNKTASNILVGDSEIEISFWANLGAI